MFIVSKIFFSSKPKCKVFKNVSGKIYATREHFVNDVICDIFLDNVPNGAKFMLRFLIGCKEECGDKF